MRVSDSEVAFPRLVCNPLELLVTSSGVTPLVIPSSFLFNALRLLVSSSTSTRLALLEETTFWDSAPAVLELLEPQLPHGTWPRCDMTRHTSLQVFGRDELVETSLLGPPILDNQGSWHDLLPLPNLQ